MVETPLILALQVEHWIQSQPGLHSESLSKTANQTRKEKSHDYQVKWFDYLKIDVTDLTPDLHGRAQLFRDCSWPSLFFHAFSCAGLLKCGGCFSLSLREEREAQQIGERLLLVDEKWLLNIGDGGSDLGAFNQLDPDLCSYRHWAVGLESASRMFPWSRQLG